MKSIKQKYTIIKTGGNFKSTKQESLWLSSRLDTAISQRISKPEDRAKEIFLEWCIFFMSRIRWKI